MKIVFIDAEFTGEHALTTLVSLGLVNLEGDQLYVSLNDYSENQVTEWLRENVLNQIDSTKSISSKEAFKLVSEWLENYSNGEKIHLVSAGKGADLILLFELWKYSKFNLKYFHSLHCLPDYLNHNSHFDLNTLFMVAGIKTDIDREYFVRNYTSNKRHNALYDAIILKECFIKLKNEGLLNNFFDAK